MKKLTRQNLNELSRVMPIVFPNEMKTYIGGNYSGGSDITYNGGTLPEVVITAPGLKPAELPVNWSPLLYELQQMYSTSYNDGNYGPTYGSSSNYGGGGGSYGGFNSNFDNTSGDNSSLTYLGGSLWKASPAITLDVIETFGKRSQAILDDRGKYYAPNAIYKMDVPVTVRLPIGNMEVTTKILNVARVGGKWVGVVGNVVEVVNIYNAYENGNHYEAGARIVINTAQIAIASAIPGVGWAIALGIGAAEAVWGDELYNYLNSLKK